MTDLISRQDAIEEVIALPNTENGYSETYDKECIIGLLKEIPSAGKAEYDEGLVDGIDCCISFLSTFTPTYPKKGKWLDFSNEGYVECPFCHSATNCDGNKEELHYCYSCGADMRGEE